MNCRQVTERLGAYCAGELTEEVVRNLDMHLASCPRCMREKQAMARVMGALGGFERIEPREDFSVRLWQRIDEWEARKRVFWLAALAGFVRRHRRVLATSCAVFVVSLLASVFVLQQMSTGPQVQVAARGGRSEPISVSLAEPLSESFVMREIPRRIEAAPDSVYMHFVTGDRPVYPGQLLDDYIYRPVVKPVSGTVGTF
jgi:anti-sigma factor RsiW